MALLEACSGSDIARHDGGDAPEGGPLSIQSVEAVATGCPDAPLVHLTLATTGGQPPLSATWDLGDGHLSHEFQLTHPYLGQGPHTITVTISDQQGASDSATLTTPPLAIDLIAASLTIPPNANPLLPGSRLEVQASLINAQDPLSDCPFGLRLLLQRHDGPSYILHEGQVEQPLASGEHLALTLTSRLPPQMEGGDYQLLLQVDQHDHIPETQETNNQITGSQSLPIAIEPSHRADLAVQGLTPSQATAFRGDPLAATARLVNNGSAPAILFLCRLDLPTTPDQPQPGPILDETFTSLGAGEALDLRMEGTLPDMEGDVWLRLTVDALDQVDEEDETNNVGLSSFPIAVAQEPPAVDLLPRGLEVTPPLIEVGQIRLLAQIVNQGDLASTSFLSRVTLADPRDPSTPLAILASVNVTTLAPGEAMAVSLPLTITTALPRGELLIGLTVDAGGAINEGDEGNNAAYTPLTLLSPSLPDLIPTDLTVQPSSALAGDEITVAFRAQNQGSAPSGPFACLLELIEGDQAVRSLTLDGPPLEPETSLSLTTSLPVPSHVASDVHFLALRITLDPWDQLDELSELNNALFAPEALMVSGGVGTCYQDPLEPNDQASQARPIDDGTLFGLSACRNDDWYLVSGLPGDQISIFVWPVSGPDLRLEVTNTQGEAFPPQPSPEGLMVALPHLDQAASFLILVPPRSGGEVYDLTVRRQSASGPFVNLVARSVTLELEGDAVPGQPLAVASLCTNFGQEASPPFDAALDLLRLDRPEPAYPDLARFPFGALWAGAGRLLSTDVPLPPEAPGGTYAFQLRVDPDSQVAEGLEEDNQALSPPFFLDPSLLCQGDPTEPNSSFSKAYPLEQGYMEGMMICRGDEDLFSFEAIEGDEIFLEILFRHTLWSDLELCAYDPQLMPMGCSASGTDNESLELRATKTGKHFAKVYAFADGHGPYGLSYRASIGPDLVPLEALAEPTVVEPGGATAIAYAVQNRRTDPSDPFAVELRLSADSVPDLSDRLLHRAEHEGLDGQGEVRATAKVILPGDMRPGIYWVALIVDPLAGEETDGANNRLMGSSLEVTTPCVDDDLEPNDGPEEAWPLPRDGAVAMDLMLCPGNEDWFGLYLRQGRQVTVTLTHDDGSDLDLEVWVPGGDVLADRGLGGEEGVTLTPPEDGDYRIRVMGYLGDGAPYGLAILREP